MAKRYELPDAAWDLVADIFDEPRRSGRPRTDDRVMLNGVLWVLCSGAAWRDMPERFGPWSTVYQRFRDWRNRGTFDQMLKRLHIKLNEQGLIDLQTWMIDSTAVRATRAASGAGKNVCLPISMPISVTVLMMTISAVKAPCESLAFAGSWGDHLIKGA